MCKHASYPRVFPCCVLNIISFSSNWLLHDDDLLMESSHSALPRASISGFLPVCHQNLTLTFGSITISIVHWTLSIRANCSGIQPLFCMGKLFYSCLHRQVFFNFCHDLFDIFFGLHSIDDGLIQFCARS